jgi:hypothetical protein
MSLAALAWTWRATSSGVVVTWRRYAVKFRCLRLSGDLSRTRGRARQTPRAGVARTAHCRVDSHLVYQGRAYGGCLASHSNLRGSITPTPRQQGMHEGEANPNPAHWSWARLLKRVFAIDMATCPQCQQSPLRLIAAITDPPLIRRILSYLKLSPTPPPIEPARWVQALSPAPRPESRRFPSAS